MSKTPDFPEKKPEFPPNSGTQIKDMQFPKMKDVKEEATGFPRFECIWYGVIKGTRTKIYEYQETPKSIPVLVTQCWMFERFENTTAEQSAYIVIEAFKKDKEIFKKLEAAAGDLAANEFNSGLSKTGTIERLSHNYEEEECDVSLQKAKNYGYKNPAC